MSYQIRKVHMPEKRSWPEHTKDWATSPPDRSGDAGLKDIPQYDHYEDKTQSKPFPHYSKNKPTPEVADHYLGAENLLP